jgi:tetratricopeptide (TPR) repeat protein
MRHLLWLTVLAAVLAPAAIGADSAADYRRQAVAYSHRKQWDKAIELYRRALAAEPEDADTHYNLALALKYKGEAAASVEEFERAVKLKPEWSAAHFG